MVNTNPHRIVSAIKSLATLNVQAAIWCDSESACWGKHLLVQITKIPQSLLLHMTKIHSSTFTHFPFSLSRQATLRKQIALVWDGPASQIVVKYPYTPHETFTPV